MMNVRLLGTGAADGIPALFAESRVSDHARRHGGKDVRSRTAALIDGCLKIDLGPDTFAQIVRDGLRPSDWAAVVFTHSDADHFSVRELQYCVFPFTADLYGPFAIYANEAICDEIDLHYPDWPLEVHRTRSFCPFPIADYLVTPVRAYHSAGEDCQNLLIERDGATFLYATDTGVWREESWGFLEARRLDGLVLECTNGMSRSSYWGHLNIEECVGVVERLRAMGTLKPGAPVYTTHHSHEGEMTHDELAAALGPHGIQPGHDGLEFRVVTL